MAVYTSLHQPQGFLKPNYAGIFLWSHAYCIAEYTLILPFAQAGSVGKTIDLRRWCVKQCAYRISYAADIQRCAYLRQEELVEDFDTLPVVGTFEYPFGNIVKTPVINVVS